jgi:hypothetical protein
MANGHDFLEMWQASQNLHATQKESGAQNKQMTAVGYISDMEEIIKACWSLFQHDPASAFKFTEISPLAPVSSGKDFPGGRTQILTVRRIRSINRHPLESDELAHLKAFLTQNIGLTEMATWIIRITVNRIA